ncbi:MAG: trehalose-phosphatase, partial [Desulfonatronovibrio sp.]
MSVWSLVYKDFNPDEEKLREALCTLGNGYFATRGAAFHAQADDTHYPGTYLAGGYNRLKTKIKDKVIENEDLVNMPNWLCLNFRYSGMDWFDLRKINILKYRQELDMKKALLLRKIRFEDSQGRRTLLQERRMVHMTQSHLAVLEVTFTPENWSGEVEFQSALDGRVVNNGVARYQGLNNEHLEPVQTS